jgi:hypothetical protein
MARINLDENQIKVNIGTDYYIINEELTQDILDMIIEFYEEWYLAKQELDKTLSKFKRLQNGDKSLLRDFKLKLRDIKLNNLGL